MIPVSPGELFDKKTILEIKQQRVADAAKLVHIGHELQLLSAVAHEVLAGTAAAGEIEALERELLAVNQSLWDIENQVRAAERAACFDAAFIEAARQVYLRNDHRAALKHRINLLLGSPLVEVKEHR
jgi:hypothetical protein